MHVTTGSAKGRKLKSVKGDSTRPITDRVKQAIFNILMDEVKDTRWLDVFAGTGAVSIEALSRGASHATLLDIEPGAVKTISDNLRLTGFESKGKVIRFDAFKYLAARPNQQFDFIYIAPPQYQGLWTRTLMVLDDNINWLDTDGTAIVQVDPKEYTAIELKNLELGDERRYGNTLLLFYDRI